MTPIIIKGVGQLDFNVVKIKLFQAPHIQ